MLSFIDEALNKITMYRLMLYFLIVLVIASFLLGLFKLSPYTPTDILFSLTLCIFVIFLTNKFFAKIFKAETNTESFLITALILILITPINFPENVGLIAFVSFFSMASKYILAIKKRHIFNPAAVSLVIAFAVLGQRASWWISSSYLILPVVIAGGLLIMKKIKSENLVLSFFISYLLIFSTFTLFKTGSLDTLVPFISTSVLDASLFFFAFVMLIEPRTSPADKAIRPFYGLVVGVFYAVSQLGLLGSFLTAEAALVLGNLFAFFANPNYRLLAILQSKNKLSENTYEFIFKKQNDFKFRSGQYMEWTLPHKRPDSRGNRRYFSISSSPTEDKLAITTKFYNPSSTYKQALLNLKVGGQIIASELSGDFTLPKDSSRPLAFIAGGIGITPFRSMVKYIVDEDKKVNIIILYSNRSKEDVVFSDIFKKAEDNGVKTIFINTEEEGRIDSEMIKTKIPDYLSRIFYLSGPEILVRSFKKILSDMGVLRSKIKTDFFPGYEEKVK